MGFGALLASSALEAPWLVRHGPAVFWCALVATAALTAAGLSWWTRRRSRRRSGTLRDGLLPAIDTASPSDDPVAIRGRLRLEVAPDLWQGGKKLPIPEGARAYLERDGRVVEIALPVEVLSGSMERWTLKSLWAPTTRSRLVRSGDEVLVRGRLVPVADAERKSDFRGEAPLMVVGASPGKRPDLAVTTAGRARVAAEIPVLGALLGAASFALLVNVSSEPLRRAAWREAQTPADDRAGAIATYGGLAALWPHDRGPTIANIESSIRATSTTSCDRHRKRARLAASLELYRTGDCVDVLNNVGSWCKAPTLLEELGSSCGTPAGLRAAAFARYLMGDFAAASDQLMAVEREHGPNMPVRARSEVVARAKVHVLAGHYDRAAAELRAFANDPAWAPEGQPTPRFACAADLAAFLAGDTAASDRLRERASAPECALAYAETLEGEARLKALRQPSLEAEPLAAVMRAPLEPGFTPVWSRQDMEVQLFPSPNAFPPRPDFLLRERSRRELLRSRADQRELEAWLSIHVLDLVMLGADAEANEAARRSADLPAFTFPATVEYTFAVRRGYVELLTMQPLTPLPARDVNVHTSSVFLDLEGLVSYFQTGSVEEVPVTQTLLLQSEDGLLSLLEAASGGDGAFVVANRPPNTDRALEATLVERKITRNREAVGRWLDDEAITWRQRCFRSDGCSPEFVVAAAAALARVARAYGAEDLAEVEGKVASAFRDGLLEPKSALLFVLLR